MQSILFLLFAYLVGSLSFAIIASKIYKLPDPRTYGSNNAGATNVMRSGNKNAAILTLIGDLLKALIVILFAKFLFAKSSNLEFIVAISGIVVIIGHIYPIFFKFKGGKGVASTIGVLLGFNIYLALLCIFSWLLIFKLSKISSLAAIIAIICAPIYAYILMGNNMYFGATLIITFFILYTHKQNIIRLLYKKEANFKNNHDNKQ